MVVVITVMEVTLGWFCCECIADIERCVCVCMCVC